MTNWQEQFEREIKATCRGALKSVYSRFAKNYINEYPQFQFLEDLSIESLCYLNRDIITKKNWTKQQHIDQFLSRCIENLREQLIEPSLYNGYIRCIMKIDAKYFTDWSIDRDDRHKKECQRLYQEFVLQSESLGCIR